MAVLGVVALVLGDLAAMVVVVLVGLAAMGVVVPVPVGLAAMGGPGCHGGGNNHQNQNGIIGCRLSN